MTLDRAFQISSRLLALIGLLSLILTREFSLMFGLTSLAATAASFIFVLGGISFHLNRRVWTVLNLAVLFGFIIDLFFISQSLLTASTHFVVFLMINKLFNLRTPQDHLQLYLISFLQLLAASTYTINISFLFSFLLYLLTATWALLLHHLATEAAGSVPGAGPDPRPSPGLTWPFFISTNGIAIGALGCTLLLFILIPRIGLGFFHRPQSDLIRMSGFSEQVDLGEIGSVKMDSTVVMRIQSSRPLPPVEGIYWRGMVFDFYDGRAWRNSLGRGEILSSRGLGVFNLGYRRFSGPTLTQEVILEPIDTAVLFGAPQIHQVIGRFPSLRINAADTLSMTSVPATRIDYTVASQLPVLSVEDTRLEKITGDSSVMRPYLQRPGASDRIGRLAEEIIQQAGSVKTVFQKTVAIESYLERHYRYTLDVRPSSSGRPVEDFLFDQKAGFCEHYAAAMVLLLRSLDIPARLVTGFLPGEWNEFGRYYTVRQSNAHAWVEVWFPRSGWIPFDPTPPAPAERTPALFGFLARSIDSLQWRWNRYVIYYGLRDQIGLVNEVKDDTMRFRRWFSAAAGGILHTIRTVIGRMIAEPMTPILTVLILILGGSAVYGIVRRLKRAGVRFSLRRPGRTPKDRTVPFYLKALDLLRARGYAKPDGLTPQEFLKRIPGPHLRAAAAELTGLYYRVRFAAIPLSDQEERRVSELLSGLKADRLQKNLDTAGPV